MALLSAELERKCKLYLCNYYDNFFLENGQGDWGVCGLSLHL